MRRVSSQVWISSPSSVMKVRRKRKRIFWAAWMNSLRICRMRNHPRQKPRLKRVFLKRCRKWLRQELRYLRQIRVLKVQRRENHPGKPSLKKCFPRRNLPAWIRPVKKPPVWTRSIWTHLVKKPPLLMHSIWTHPVRPQATWKPPGRSCRILTCPERDCRKANPQKDCCLRTVWNCRTSRSMKKK